jgi:hypothetical protein
MYLTPILCTLLQPQLVNNTITSDRRQTDNAAAIINKIGKDGSPIAFDKASVLTAAAYTALATKVSTTLYFNIMPVYLGNTQVQKSIFRRDRN